MTDERKLTGIFEHYLTVQDHFQRTLCLVDYDPFFNIKSILDGLILTT